MNGGNETETAFAPAVCWPWSLHWMADFPTHPKGGSCIYCRRDIALPPEARRGACLYCALDRGLTPEIEEEWP